MNQQLTDMIKNLADTSFDCGDFDVTNVENNECYAPRYEAFEKAKKDLSDYLTEKLQKMAKGITAVQQLIDESVGVEGLHKNGDVAYWQDLLPGGRHEGWLSDFGNAVDIAKEFAI